MAVAVQRPPPPTSPKMATQINPTHVIRVNVLGMAGITVDRKKCNDICRKKDHPAPPKNMRAVVAVARDSQIEGTTTPSKLLARSPSDDVIVTGTAVDGDETLAVNGSRRGDDEQTQGTGLNNLHRHVAVWASDDNRTLGSLVTFDACLSTSSLDQQNSTASVSSKYVPKSFELIVALSDDSKANNKVALPFGVANINISGDECPAGETIVLDLPILSLMQARPIASNENGMASYQMIAIKPKKAEADVAPQKQGAFGRLFGKKRDKKSPRTPSIAKRSRFTEAYSADPSGDAILRVQLQVIEKVASKLQRESMTEIAPGVKALEKDTKEDDRSLDTYEESSFGTFAELKSVNPDASIISHRTSDSNSVTEGSRILNITGSRTFDSRTVDSRTDDSRTVGSRTVDSRTIESRTVDSRTIDSRTVDSRTVDSRTIDSRTIDSRTIDSKNLALHTFDHAEMKAKESCSIVDDEAGSSVADDDLADEQAKSRVDESDDALNLTIMRIFGREVRFPACGLPVCSDVKPGEFDEESIFSSLRQNDTLSTMTMLLPNPKGKQTTFFDQATLQSTIEQDNVTNTSKSTEKGVEMRLHGPSSGTGDNMTTPAKSAEASFAYSPKGVEKFPEEDQQEENTRSASSKRPVSLNMSDRFVQMFRCGHTDDSRSDDVMPYKETGVPGLVIPGDASSVGDLTAISHELRIDKKRTVSTGSKRYPVACGGNGVCSSTDLVDDDAVALRGFEIQHFSTSAVAKRPAKENYFSEYNETSFVGPNTPQPLKKTEPGDASLEMSFKANSSEPNLANIPITITEAASEF